MLSFFDLRSAEVLYADRVEGTGNYFSIGKKTKNYEDISRIELDCYSANDEYKTHFIFFAEGQKLASFKLKEESLRPLIQVNAILRDQDNTVFEPRMYKKRESKLFSSCIEKLGTELGEPESVRRILKVER